MNSLTSITVPASIHQLVLDNGHMIDLNVVREMTGDDDGFMRQLVSMFLATTTETLKTIDTQFKEGDLSGVRNTVHRFKSSCGILGNRQLLHFIAHVEHIAYEGDPEVNLKSQLRILYRVVDRVVEELTVEMNKLQAA